MWIRRIRSECCWPPTGRACWPATTGATAFCRRTADFRRGRLRPTRGDAQHPATVYVGVVNDKESGGVFVSHTGGLSWSQLSDGLDGHDVFSLGQAPDGSILAGTEHGIYRLKDAVWQRVGDDAKIAAAVKTAPAVGKTAPAVGKTAPAANKSAAAGKTRRRRSGMRRSGRLRRGLRLPRRRRSFDGSVYGFAMTGETLFAATSEGVLRSVTERSDVGAGGFSLRWTSGALWRRRRRTVVAASLGAVEMSTDGGNTWQAVALPAEGDDRFRRCRWTARASVGRATGTEFTISATGARAGRR